MCVLCKCPPSPHTHTHTPPPQNCYTKAAEKIEEGRKNNLHYQRRKMVVELRDQEDRAALFMQGLWRKKKAREEVVRVMERQWQKVWDENESAYYYYNNITGESQWEKPALLPGTTAEEDDAAAIAGGGWGMALQATFN